MQWQELRSHLRHLSESDLLRVQEAFVTGQRAHAGQTRKSGEPYFTHPIAIAYMLADMGADADTIIAALLHDVVEDTDTTLPQIRMQFGDTVGNLIDGLTKLERSDLGDQPSLDEQIETLRKMFTLMQEDIRIMIIKLVDRLHNMQTINFLASEKQRKLAQETIDVYVKIADRLSMQDIRDELEALCLPILHPKEFAELEDLRMHNEQVGRKTIARMAKKLEQEHNDLFGNIRMLHEHKNWIELRKQHARGGAQVTGLSDIIVVFSCPTIDMCYTILGSLHQLWQRETLSFQDYINSPLLNGYQGLHTTVILEDGTRVRCKIRTEEMHTYARKGIASRSFTGESKGVLEALLWAQRISTVAQDTVNRSEEFWQSLQSDLLGETIIVHGAHGEIMHVPNDSTALDAAFYLFEDKALRTQEILVNGQPALFAALLPNAASLEVRLAKQPMVNRKWLDWVNTGLATATIRHSLRTHSDQDKLATGRMLIDEKIQKNRGGFINDYDERNWNSHVQKLGYKSIEAAYIALADGELGADELYETLFHTDLTQQESRVVMVEWTFQKEQQEVNDSIEKLQETYNIKNLTANYRRTRKAHLCHLRATLRLNPQEQRSLRSELDSMGATSIFMETRQARMVRYMFCIAIMILWGIDPVISTKILQNGMEPVTLTLLRSIGVFGTAVLLLGASNVRSNLTNIPLRSLYLWISGISLFGISIFTYLALDQGNPVLYNTILRGNALLVALTQMGRHRNKMLGLASLFVLLGYLSLIAVDHVSRGFLLSLVVLGLFYVYTIASTRFQATQRIGARYPQYFLAMSSIALLATLSLIPLLNTAGLTPAMVLLSIAYSVGCIGFPYVVYYWLTNRYGYAVVSPWITLSLFVTFIGEAAVGNTTNLLPLLPAVILLVIGNFLSSYSLRHKK